ncbi:MAG: transketolase C-terminal domain-containing protein, partial [Atribacterota bacterium]|nr:transketolase C-terminal domain-containing protein [Atribacterota bacterium]
CLKLENIGFATIGEIPCVIVNSQRGGPSTGLPTKPSQGDVMQARWGTHGDHPVIALAPSNVKEVLLTTIKAVNFSEKYRTPVMILLDEVISHMREKVLVPSLDELEIINRKKPREGKDCFMPFKADDDLVPPMADFGDGYRYHVTGLVHNEKGYPTSDTKEIDNFLRRINNKIEFNKKDLFLEERFLLEDADIAIIAYGSVARAAERTVKMAREKGIKAGLLKLITLWPFNDCAIKMLSEKVKLIIVPEMNLGQMVGEVERNVQGKCPVIKYSRIDGNLITPMEILVKIEEEVDNE